MTPNVSAALYNAAVMYEYEMYVVGIIASFILKNQVLPDILI
jgi:hypothetical protein